MNLRTKIFQRPPITALVVAVVGLAVAACGSDPDVVETGQGAETSTTVFGQTDIIGSLEITHTHPSMDSVVYTIGCLGDTFSVTAEIEGVDAGRACGLLEDDELLTRLVEGPPEDQACTMIHGGDDEALIVGQIGEHDINATVTLAGGCEIDTWNRLLGLLPPPVDGIN